MLRRACCAIVLLLPGCFHPDYDHPACGAHGECPSGTTCSTALICETDGKTPQQRTAHQKWEQAALPVLRQDCLTCHNGSRPNVGFLIGPDDDAIHDTLMTFKPSVVDLETVSSSQIVTKGLHEGPQLTADESVRLLDWLFAERDAANQNPDNPTTQLATKPFAVQLCTGGEPDNAQGTCPTNHVSLVGLPTDGTMLAGAEIAFTAQALGDSSLYLTNLVGTGGTSGFYLEHMLFVSRPAKAAPFLDQIDRYYNLQLNVRPGMSIPIDGGTEDFVGFVPTDMVEIHFKVLTAYQPDTTGSTRDGCKMLPSFKINAQPSLRDIVAGATQSCASCHAGSNDGATGAMDLSRSRRPPTPTSCSPATMSGRGSTSRPPIRAGSTSIRIQPVPPTTRSSSLLRSSPRSRPRWTCG